MKIDTGIECMHFQHIPAKSPDDYDAFGLWERSPSKRKPTTIESCARGLENNASGNFKKSTPVMEITMHTCSPETKLSDWISKKVGFTI